MLPGHNLQFPRFQIAFRGITGLVDFDQLGYRTSFALDVMTITINGFVKVEIILQCTKAKLNANVNFRRLASGSSPSTRANQL